MGNYFYNKTIELYSSGDDVRNDAGIVITSAPLYIKNIECDIQPYSKDLLYKNYGYQVDCTKRVFCEIDNDVKLGCIIKYNSINYKIVKIIEWDTYIEVVINDI